MTKAGDYHILQGRSAGFVTRLLAYVVDLVVVAGILSLGGWLAVLVDHRRFLAHSFASSDMGSPPSPSGSATRG
ncbi:MAG: hypothetical protein QGM46_07560 [Actinomycetota bacterium]|nr:hypothetical protein [Actinomycetota bacterium]MDK1037548.1 hypothetical protein [Actinomycetota bacterium]MDK1096724.1 hypothetical protein [Actinomycetota bacterium]MDK1292188.1 hypothetical protein [Actinomycetota bacterium]